MGCDNSINLCSICARNGHHILACDLTQLPYKEDSFDALICIAVMHHLASKVWYLLIQTFIIKFDFY